MTEFFTKEQVLNCLNDMVQLQEAHQFWRDGVFQAKLLVEKLNTPELFEYYVNRTRSSDSRIFWLWAYTTLYRRYYAEYKRTFSLNERSHVAKLDKLRKKGIVATEKLFDLL